MSVFKVLITMGCGCQAAGETELRATGDCLDLAVAFVAFMEDQEEVRALLASEHHEEDGSEKLTIIIERKGTE